ncbi:hypothetical protein FS837_008287 [Tulasnella sp. UAMH 9824]|nr:hypothetical protein FS837_008287 [Tulasnella sp. UAMH 9824]
MKLSTLLITSIPFIPSMIAAAIPDVVAHNETLAKRGGEINYLANCQRFSNTSSDWYKASYVAWYSNVDNSQSGNDRPTSLSNEYRDWAAGGKFISSDTKSCRKEAYSLSAHYLGDHLHWEGQQHSAYFSDSGVSVQTHIASDAQGRANGAYAGWAQRTSDRRKFNCYKDTGRDLFVWPPPVPDGTNRFIMCQAIYYCI